MFNHNGKILGLSSSTSKPLFVTCSVDRMVKVWNYYTNQLVHTFQMNEDPISVQFHPSGLHLGIAFSDKLVLINLYPEGIENKKRSGREIQTKNLTCVSFSWGGDKIAIASGNP